MKRILYLLMVFLLILSLSSCAKQTEEDNAQLVIKEVGELAVDSYNNYLYDTDLYNENAGFYYDGIRTISDKELHMFCVYDTTYDVSTGRITYCAIDTKTLEVYCTDLSGEIIIPISDYAK